MTSRFVYAIPKLLAPEHQEIDVLLHCAAAFTDAYRVDFDANLFRTEAPDTGTDTCFEERHAIPRHVQLNSLGEYGVSPTDGAAIGKSEEVMGYDGRKSTYNSVLCAADSVNH